MLYNLISYRIIVKDILQNNFFHPHLHSSRNYPLSLATILLLLILLDVYVIEYFWRKATRSEIIILKLTFEKHFFYPHLHSCHYCPLLLAIIMLLLILLLYVRNYFQKKTIRSVLITVKFILEKTFFTHTYTVVTTVRKKASK